MIAPLNNPLPDGSNGQDSKGRFAPGNKLGKGNPYNKRAQELRTLFVAELSDDRMKKIAVKVIRMAIKGDMEAIREVFLRVFGKPANPEQVLGSDDGETIFVPWSRDALLDALAQSAKSKAGH